MLRRCGVWQNIQAMLIKRGVCWHLRLTTMGATTLRLLGLVESCFKLLETGCCASTPRARGGEDRKPPGAAPKLTAAHRTALAQIMRKGQSLRYTG